jgi:ribosome-binding protein aMBF1 (putative translation factor)
MSSGNSQPTKPDYNERFKLRGDSLENVIRRVAYLPNGKSNSHLTTEEMERLQVIAQTVRERRESFGWSRAELARIAGIVPTTVRSLEQAQRLPRPETLHKIEVALEVHLTV